MTLLNRNQADIVLYWLHQPVFVWNDDSRGTVEFGYQEYAKYMGISNDLAYKNLLIQPEI
jgi:hypothetical protein